MTMAPLTHLGELTVGEFLADYWQQKPVCIRKGIAFQEALIAVDELAGLALESEVESRLIAVSYTHLTLPTIYSV